MTNHETNALDDADRLERLYHDEGLSQQEIGEQFDVTRQAVGAAMKRHGIEVQHTGGSKHYTTDELLEWIDSFVLHFGIVPSYQDAKAWPGPKAKTYEYRFGSWQNAVEAAGYETRGNQ
jgi:DNA-binding transcriptional regulator LsrR (DeoR family)